MKLKTLWVPIVVVELNEVPLSEVEEEEEDPPSTVPWPELPAGPTPEEIDDLIRQVEAFEDPEPPTLRCPNESG